MMDFHIQANKLVLEAHFPHISWSIELTVSKKKKKRFTHVSMCGFAPTMWISWKLIQNCELYCDESNNYYYKLIIIINWKSRSVSFEWKLKNVHKVLLLEMIFIWKKILWKNNFVLIKFLRNTLLFEKSWNKCKNSSFLHKAMCTESDHGSTKMQCCISTFMALYFRWLCTGASI